MSLSYTFSLVFYIAFVVYFIFGIYIISINTKNILNRLFFILCLALSIWAFCFSIANSSQVYGVAIFWRRLASLGWGTVYSLLLHFFLVMTEREKILKKSWLYILLYLPAMGNIYIFGFSDFARGQYTLINTAMGWINVSKNAWSDLYFNYYYVSFTITGLWLLWNWGRKSKDSVKKKQAYLFITSFAMAIILGTMTDVIVNKYTSFYVPQMAPVISLIPTTAIFYAIKRYGLMGRQKIDKAEPGKILSEVSMEKFIRIMSFVYIIAGLLNFAAQYFFYQIHPNLNSVLLFSLLLFIIGIILQIIRRIPMKAYYRESIFILLMLASVIVTAIKFIENASITVWAAPFIIVMLSVLFNKRRLIIWIGISIIITQIYIWFKIPIKMVEVDGSDYLVRIGILSITIWMAYFVNQVYIQRLEENEAQIRDQKMVSKISADFVKVTESNLDKNINEMLKLIGEHFEVDRAFFIGLSHRISHEWFIEDIESVINVGPNLSSGAFSWWIKQMRNNGVINIPDVEMLPCEAGEEKAILKHHKIKSLISIPVTNKGEIQGLLFLASVKESKTWQGKHQELLKIVANLLSDALVKVEAEKKINHMAYYDTLTGLPNRSLFNELLEQSIYLANGTENLIGMVFMDLDSFKSVNDTVGHQGGDEMLQQLACRLSECLRKQDVVSRFGGDEFMVMLSQMGCVEDILKTVGKLMESISQPLTVKGQEFFITASAGIAVYPIDGECSEELVKNADLAMYAAKEKGKNQYALCSPAIKEKVLEKTQLTNSLYRAQENNEFILYYQPQMSVLTKEIIGLEALIRWNNEDFGMISPATFIPLAEQTGLIIPIGQWVLETACRQNKEWQILGLPPMRMAVNLSVVQLQDRNLISIVETTLSKTGLEPKYLEFEITESTAADGNEDINHVLHGLKEMGVTISIDDFGSMYSSLNRLKTLPIDRIKIDMQFVRGISEGNKDDAIAKTIIQLAKNLNLNVIAEGVETESQFEFFKRYECDEIQGYFFYKPMPASEIEPILFNQLSNDALGFEENL